MGGIPYYSTEDDIRSFFEGCGTVTGVDCMMFPESGKFRGIAILTFKVNPNFLPPSPISFWFLLLIHSREEGEKKKSIHGIRLVPRFDQTTRLNHHPMDGRF